MKITWEWSPNSEAHRIIDTARQIDDGFYYLQHFLPLPWSHDVKYTHSGVYLPLLNYDQIPNFWLKASKLTKGFYPLDIPSSLSSQIESNLAHCNLVSPDITNLKNITTSTLPKVIDFIKILSPTSRIPSSIVIHPTYFGTLGSFAWDKTNTAIIIFLRHDQGIKTIVECLLTCILRRDATDQLAATWNETEFLVDWLIQISSLANILKNDVAWQGTLKTTRSAYSPLDVEMSEKFLTQIGVVAKYTKAFTIKDELIYFNGLLLANLTPRESSLLSLFITKSPSPVSNDEIGNILFSNEEKFSLATIAKTIERLRTKLEIMGISRHYLATASGFGYYLKN